MNETAILATNLGGAAALRRAVAIKARQWNKAEPWLI
jgi:hypothetical protein